MRVEFSIKKLDYQKWWIELIEYFGSQVVKHGWQRTSRSKVDQWAIKEFHRLNKTTNYKIVFEVEDEG